VGSALTEAAARPDDAPDPAASAPVDAPASQPEADTFDSSIREFESATAPPEPVARPQAAPDEIDRLLSELQGNSPDELGQALAQFDAQPLAQAQQQLAVAQSENQQLRAFVEHQRAQRDFSRLTAEIQGKLPAHLPADYAETQLLAEAVNNPTLQAAFDFRNVDRAAVDRELRLVEGTLQRLGRDPNANPQYVAQLTQHSYRLGLALNSQEILRRAAIEIGKRAAAHRPIDETATAEHDAVRAAVLGASGKAQPEPPPNFGQMSDRQLREYTKTNFGF
jgi:hypothetical protein